MRWQRRALLCFAVHPLPPTQAVRLARVDGSTVIIFAPALVGGRVTGRVTGGSSGGSRSSGRERGRDLSNKHCSISRAHGQLQSTKRSVLIHRYRHLSSDDHQASY